MAALWEAVGFPTLICIKESDATHCLKFARQWDRIHRDRDFMDDHYIARPLDRRQVDQAYAVVRTVVPDVDMDQWRSFALPLVGSTACHLDLLPSGIALATTAEPAPVRETPAEDTVGPAANGIMTVQSSRGYIHGLFSYAIEQQLKHGAVLTVDNFIVVDMFDPESAALVLLRAMERLAHDLACDAIHTHVPNTGIASTGLSGKLASYFHNDGHIHEAQRFCKRLTGANDNAAET